MVALKGGDGLEAKLRELAGKVDQGATARVGFLEGATYPDGTSVPLVAVLMNYGAPARGVPPRPFFSKAIDDNKAKWPAALGEVFKAADFDAEKTLALFGEGVAGQVRQSIVETSDPPLSPVTLLLRERFPGGSGTYTFADVLQARRDIAEGVQPSGAHSNPLVWSGHLLQSVDVEVTRR